MLRLDLDIAYLALDSDSCQSKTIADLFAKLDLFVEAVAAGFLSRALVIAASSTGFGINNIFASAVSCPAVSERFVLVSNALVLLVPSFSFRNSRVLARLALL
jgi:hypothetical protein